MGKKCEHKTGSPGARQAVAKLFLGLAVIVVFFAPLPAYAQTGDEQPSGAQLFKKKTCNACHTIGGGRRVGPDLSGLSSRREKEWLFAFIASPKHMIDSGDPVAVGLLEEYKTLMPDPGLSQSEIELILTYIDEQDAAGDSKTPVSKEELSWPEPTEEAILRGQDLFQGKIRFQNRGPSCISCHSVKNDAVIGGGILAKELTTTFSTLGGEGTKAILGSPPFPVMRQAFEKNPLTAGEVSDLTAFLQHADKEHSFQQPFDYGVRLFGAGVFGCLLLFGFYWLVGLRRKNTSVYHSIHSRQIKSS